MSGSPPQIETTGAGHWAPASMHSSTERRALFDSYSRIFPQPMHARLQARVGSSIRTSGYSSPLRFWVATYLPICTVERSGNFMSGVEPFSQSPEGHEREVETVEVIADHEVCGKARAGVVLLAPVAV